MDLLDSILRCSKAYHYKENFEFYGIVPSTLKLLTDEDLQIIGVEEEKVRKALLKNISKLKVPAEIKVDLKITNEYINQILYEISKHLTLHHANLTHATNRDDIIICNIKLGPAANCLLSCIGDLDKQIVSLERLVAPKRKKKTRKMNLVLFIASTAIASVCAFKLVKWK